MRNILYTYTKDRRSYSVVYRKRKINRDKSNVMFTTYFWLTSAHLARSAKNVTLWTKSNVLKDTKAGQCNGNDGQHYEQLSL